MNRILKFALLLATLPVGAQTTTVAIPTTTKIAGIPRLGINLGGGQTALSYFGPNQLFKDLNYAQGGSMPAFTSAVTYECNPGSNSIYNWSNDIADTQGYTLNYWAGATFTTVTKDTGTSIGSGTVTGSTANTTYPGSGVLLTGLNPALSRPCNPTSESPYTPYGDVLIARLLTPSAAMLALMTPNFFYGGFPSSSTWNTTDTSPASTNTYHSLQLLTGTSASFADDAVLQNATNPNGSLAATYVPWINLNGTGYTQSVKAKCLTAGCTLGVYVGRPGGTTFLTTTLSPTYNTTPGAGWQTFNNTFNASETGAQTSGIYYVLSCTGTCLLQDAELLEPSTLSGNTTPFRDAVVSELRDKMHAGSLRYMDSSQWCSDVADEIAPTGNRRWCGNSQYVSYVQGPPIGYDDFLQLANVVGADAWISVGITNGPSDWTTLINWLNSSGWVSTFNTAGHKIYLEYGNEPWNTGSTAQVVDGNGIAYGGLLGPNMTAARAAYTGSDSSVIKLVGASWIAPDQGSTPYGWINNMMSAAGCTTGAQTSCPDFVDNAPYTLNYLNNFDTTGSNVSTTGAPFLDEWAEISNIDSVCTTPSDWMYASGSICVNTAYGLMTYNIPMATYESNVSTTNGNTVTQTQMNQIDGSVGTGLAQAQHMLLQQRDAGVSGPINYFALAQNYFNYNDTHPPAVPMWGSVIALATGPGQAVNSANYERPVQTAMDIINTAIGSNNNLIASTQSGTPTFSYAGGQPESGYAGTKNTILANSAVPDVNCFVYANNAKQNWTTICFNNNLTSSETVSLTGAGAPTGSVTQVLFPNSTNVITDNNEATYVGPSSLPLVVNYPTATSTSGTSYTIPAASMLALTYTTSGTPQAATPGFSPGSGSYSSAQTVAITSSTSGVTICATQDGTTPTSTTGTCTHGTTLSNGGTVTVSTSQTVKALATIASGYTDSNVNSASYTIETAAATPTFSPVGGTYSGTQSVTLSTATGGCSAYLVWNATNAQSGGNLTGTSSTNPISVTASETIYAQVQSCPGSLNSAISSAAYVITGSPTASAPTFAKGTGTYIGSVNETLSTSTSGCSGNIVYNSTGNQSGGNLTGITTGTTYNVNEPGTYYAQVQGCSGYSNSTISTATYAFNHVSWYVDPTKGGTRYSSLNTSGQCNGLSATAYVSGVNQNCPFNDPRLLWNDPYSYNTAVWIIAGGDKVIFSGYEQGTGLTGQISGSVSLGSNLFCYGIGSQCTPPPIPSGTSSQHTQFLGTLCQTSCYAAWAGSAFIAPTGWSLYDPTKVEYLWGGGTSSGIPEYLLTLAGSQYVDIFGLDLSDHSSCNSYGSPANPNGCANQYLAAGVGIITNNATANVTIQDTHLHGFQARGLWGPIGGAITMTRDLISFNGFAGWDFDDGSATPDAVGSSIAASYVVMSGNGCNEEYPVTDSYPAWTCYDSGTGGFGDSWSGQQTALTSFTGNHIAQYYNTKDGFLGPHTTIGYLGIFDSASIGNGGQQWKWATTTGNTTVFQNNLTVGNCLRLNGSIPGQPADYYQSLGSQCRAAGDVFSFGADADSNVLLANNTTVTYQPTVFDVTCDTTNACGSTTFTFTNNLNLGYTCAASTSTCYPSASGSAPGVYYTTPGDSSITLTKNYNLEYGMRNGDCPGATNHAICSDPLLYSEPGQGSPPPPQSTLDVFQPVASTGFQPSSSSPAKAAGVSYTGLLSLDFYGTATTSPPVIGAVNAAAPAPPTGGSVSGGNQVSGGPIVFGP
jgi:chitobiase/beta-hexosaminidase-like protein